MTGRLQQEVMGGGATGKHEGRQMIGADRQETVSTLQA